LCEVQKKKRKFTLSSTSQEKDLFFIYELHRKKKNGPLFTTLYFLFLQEQIKGIIITPPPSSSLLKTLFGQTLPKLHASMGARPRPRQAATAAAGGDGAREARTGPRPTRTLYDTPDTS